MTSREHALKTSEDFYTWARASSGLHTPVKAFEAKGGRGIYRRFFYFIPAKGAGAVNRANRKKFKPAIGSSRLHEFVDIGVPGTVQTRRAACHSCENCWSCYRRECENKAYVGEPQELQLQPEAIPTTNLSRVTRQTLDHQAIARAQSAVVDSCVCIETARMEKQVPWLLAKVLSLFANADIESVADEATPRLATQLPVELDTLKAGEPALKSSCMSPLMRGHPHILCQRRLS